MMDGIYQLGLTRPSGSKSMLGMAEDIVVL